MGNDTVDAELRNLAERLVDSWNRGDAPAFARLFTPAAEYVTGAGERIRGREAIAALVERGAFAAPVSLVSEPVVRCEGPSARVTFIWSSTGVGGPPRQGRITCACIREGSDWLIDALDNNEHG